MVKMKATLKIENIGQMIGLQTLNFNSGVVTLIKGKTAAGKSRIIKSFALALSYPIKSENLIEDGINFGILKSDEAEYLPLVNSSKDDAIIELIYDDVKKKVELFRDGKIEINTPGNQKFLYSSMLVKNSRIHNYITRGNADFKWIVDEMSLAKDYEKILAGINYQIEDLKSKEEEIDQKKKLIGKKEKDKKEKESEKKILLVKLKEKDNEIGKYKFDPKIIQEEREISKNLDNVKKAKREELANKDKLEKKIEDLKKKVKIDKTIEEIKKKQKEKENEAEILKKTKVEELQKFIINFQKLKSKEEQEKVKYETRKQLWEMVKIEEGNKCPLCQSVGKITKEDKKLNIDEYNKYIKEHQVEIKKLTSQINRKQDEINKKADLPEIEKKISELTNKLLTLLRESEKSKLMITQITKKINATSPRIKSYNEDISKYEKDLAEVQVKKQEDVKFQKLKNEKSKIDQGIGSIKEKLEKIEKAINDAKSIEIYELQINDLDTAKKTIEEFVDILNETRDYLDIKISEQREGAAKKFNTSTKNLIRELKFDTFKEIYLNLNDYRLKIMDNNDDSQELSSISGGEKAIISSLLQISAKETYLAEIPFLIGDEIILDLDPERGEIFLNYLKKIAKEKDWFIILTQINNEDLTITEI